MTEEEFAVWWNKVKNWLRAFAVAILTALLIALTAFFRTFPFEPPDVTPTLTVAPPSPTVTLTPEPVSPIVTPTEPSSPIPTPVPPIVVTPTVSPILTPTPPVSPLMEPLPPTPTADLRETMPGLG